MTREEAKEQLKQIPIHDGVSDNYLKTIYEAIDIAIKSLEQQPCDDCISRQAVLELVGNYDLSMGQVVKAIHVLPSVTPKEKTGTWLCSDDMSELAVCSLCKKDIGEPFEYAKMSFNYCPNCGAKMVSE